MGLLIFVFIDRTVGFDVYGILMCICCLIRVIGFDHRKSVLSTVSCDPGFSGNVSFRVDLDKSSSTAAYEYFSTKLLLTESSDVSNLMLFVIIFFSKLVHILCFGNLWFFSVCGKRVDSEF